MLSDLETDPRFFFIVLSRDNLTIGCTCLLCRIDVTIDGCDEADDALTLIKGGGGCQTQEKVKWYFRDRQIVQGQTRWWPATVTSSW